MARSPEWEKLEMAAGDPKPAWPLPSVKPKFATWSIGGGRPFGCEVDTCARWHAGVDLTGAPGGAVVVAPEDGVVIGVDRGWSGEAKAIFMRTTSGLFLVLGGVVKGSSKEFEVAADTAVAKGDRLGRVLGSYGMIHFETYKAESRKANSIWWKGQRPPKGLLNPTNYVERMVGDRISLVRTVQRHEALRALGHYTGDPAAPWGEASKTALREAQKALGVEADGIWGPNTEDAILAALAKRPGGPKDCKGDVCPVDPPADSSASPEGWSTGTKLALAGAGVIGLTVAILMVRRRRAA